MDATVARWQEVIDLLRAWGFTVIEVPGWQTRGKGALRILAWIWHHTAGPAAGDTPSLRVVTFGREGLRNALSNTYTSRSGVIYMVAAKVAWHAGRGGKGSNSTLGGNEAENTGVGEAWTHAHYRAQVALAAAVALVFGTAPALHWDHKEHAPSRKVDRQGIHPPAFRGDVLTFLAGLSTPAAPELEEDPVKLWNVAGDLYVTSGVQAVHVGNTGGNDTIAAVAKAYKLKVEAWPGNADTFVDAHIIHAGGGSPRPRQSTVTS